MDSRLVGPVPAVAPVLADKSRVDAPGLPIMPLLFLILAFMDFVRPGDKTNDGERGLLLLLLSEAVELDMR